MDFLYVEQKKDVFIEEKENLKNNINEIENNINSKKKKKKD